MKLPPIPTITPRQWAEIMVEESQRAPVHPDDARVYAERNVASDPDALAWFEANVRTTAAPAPLASFAGLKAEYLRQVLDLARDGDVYPQPAIVIDSNGAAEMFMVAADGNYVLSAMRKRYREGGVAGFAFGIDRNTLPGQGTEHSSVVTWAVVYGDEVAVGVVDYDAGGTVNEPSETASEFWNERMRDNVRYVRDEKTTGKLG